MYGIITDDGRRVLCSRSGTKVYILKTWARAGMPASRKSALEIDKLLQDYMTASGNYNMRVCKFTEEQVNDLIIKKLQGY